jgi:hypothetical protein
MAKNLPFNKISIPFELNFYLLASFFINPPIYLPTHYLPTYLLIIYKKKFACVYACIIIIVYGIYH